MSSVQSVADLPKVEPVSCSSSEDTCTQLRIALRRLAKAVVLITCKDSGQRFVMAATAVSELSMDPPSMLVCVNKTASIYEPLRRVEHFGICILHSSHRTISQNCSGAVKGEARFRLGAWAESAIGIPYLRDAQASIFCRMDTCVNFGTHGVFFGRVLSAQTTGEVSPLVYVDGEYATAPLSLTDERSTD